ncbi:MAG TPA: diadenylate cyclase [Planctomycetaceae bacterium]|nr:diadenylate cyclase [Planctomycetaceae bacterium]
MPAIARLFSRFDLSIGVADVVDIAVVAVMLYALLSLFRAAVHRTVSLAVALLAGVYLAARQFDLYLTVTVFHAGFVGLLIVLAIVYQEEIRRGFLRLHGWRPLGRAQRGWPGEQIDTLAEFPFACGEARVGALLAVKGREPLEPHLGGGISLSAPLHPALLQSVVDPRSPGHDGAIVIDEGRIVRMSTHLPLSTNYVQIGTRGTRHSAGLGLAEVSDALVIIVSEERGTVSVAQDARIAEVGSAAELKQRLVTFLSEKFALPYRRGIVRRLFRHPGRKLAAVALAVAGWLIFAAHTGTVERTFVVPIEYRNVPPGLELDESAPADARLTLSGPEPAFSLLLPARLKISVDLTGDYRGDVQIHLGEQNSNHPANLRVNRIEPPVLRFELVPESAEEPDGSQAAQSASSEAAGATSGGRPRESTEKSTEK